MGPGRRGKWRQFQSRVWGRSWSTEADGPRRRLWAPRGDILPGKHWEGTHRHGGRESPTESHKSFTERGPLGERGGGDFAVETELGWDVTAGTVSKAPFGMLPVTAAVSGDRQAYT